MKRILFAVVLLLTVVALLASCADRQENEQKAEETGDFTFVKNSDMASYVLTKYTGTDRGIEIPSSYQGYPVRVIGASAFENNETLQSVVIPNSIQRIEKNAFANCNHMVHCVIGNGVTSIGAAAFNGCFELTNITIPISVTSIGDRIFYNCSGLTNIMVEDGNQKYHSTGNCLIETESKTLIAGIKNSVIPSDGSITSIGDYAFQNCRGLISVSIPNSVTSIGFSAFENLTSINYQGTQSQWNAINKGLNWNNNVGKYIVHCSDGDISINNSSNIETTIETTRDASAGDETSSWTKLY